MKPLAFSAAIAAFLCAVPTFAQSSSSGRTFDVRAVPDFGPGARVQEEGRPAASGELELRLAQLEAETGSTLARTSGRFGTLRTLSARSGYLTAADSRPAATVARAYLSANADLFGLTPEDVAGLTARTETGRATRTVTLTQRLDGVRVFRGDIRISTDRLGRILRVNSGDAHGDLHSVGEFVLTEQEAATRALSTLGVDEVGVVESAARPSDRWRLFSADASRTLPRALVERTAFPMNDGGARLAYRVLAYSEDAAYDVVLSADDGRLLYRSPLAAENTMSVWTESPLAGARETLDAPKEWFSGDGTTTQGAYVDSFVDIDGDDVADPFNFGTLRDGRAFNEQCLFSFQAGDGFSDVLEFPAHAAANAFYFGNRSVEFFKTLGFDDPAGAFAAEDDAAGGAPGDPIEIHVLDGGVRANANSLATPDGVSPIINLGTLQFADGSQRSFANDGQTVIHEATHLLVERLIGGVDDVGCTRTHQARSVTEGLADYFAASYYGNPVVGAYPTGNEESGFRRFSLDDNPLTAADILDPIPEVHNDGEVWAAILWDLRTALGASFVDALVVDALRIMPCDPNWVDVRDALLAADRAANGNTNQRTLWAAFAARGLGASASADEDLSRGYRTLLNAATDMPEEFGGGNRPPEVTSSPPEIGLQGQTESYQLLFRDPDGDAVTVEMTDAPKAATFNAQSGQVLWPANFSGARFEFTLTDSRGNRTVHVFYWESGLILQTGRPTVVEGIGASTGLAAWLLTGEVPAVQFTMRGGTGDPDMTVISLDGVFEAAAPGSDETITINSPTPGVHFVFVDAFREYSGVVLQVDRVRPTTLMLDARSGPYVGPFTSERIFRVDVPPGTSVLRIQATPERGASLAREQTVPIGDADLFAAFGRVPTCQTFGALPCDFDASSENNGSYEALEIENPTPGEWFVTLYGFQAFRGVTIETSTTPSPVKLSGVTEAAGFDESLALLGISTLFGSGFTDAGPFEASSLPIPNSLDGLELFVDGHPAGQFFLNGAQSNFQFPQEAGVGPFTIVGFKDGVVTDSLSGFAFRDVPRMFTFNLNGQVLPVVIHADGSAVTPDNPARPGETLIAFLTGISSVTHRPGSGLPGLADPLSTSLLETTVEIGGTAGTTVFSGWAPNFVSLMQVNFVVDPATPGGLQSFVIRFGDLLTQDLEIPVLRE